MLRNDERLEIQGVYNTLYNATTRPDFKFVITRYFIDEWVPLLGPSLAWLVVGLRQQCFWNRRRNWCIVDKSTLSDETGLDKRTIERSLKKPLSRWFVLEVNHRYRYRHQIGKKVRDKNRYQLLLDDPLSPRHQLGLADLLRQTITPDSDRLNAAITAVKTILDMPNLLDQISISNAPGENLQRRTVLQLVEEVMELSLVEYAEDKRVVLLDQYCSQLHNQIVQPNKIYVGWQYYRLRWVPLLGHALAWLVIYLRRHCYWDETSGELRDTYTTYKKDLAAALGQTTRNLANLMDNPHVPLFLSILNPEAGRNAPTVYQVRLVDEPLIPDDQQKIALELRQQLQGDFFERDPEHGQLNLFPIFDRLSTRQNFAYGHVQEKMSSSEPKKSRLDFDASEKMPQQQPLNFGKNAAIESKDSLILSDLNKISEQQKPAAPAQSKALEILLNDMGVQEPTKSKLLADPGVTVTKLGAWYLYAETQPGLFDPRSYVIRRLLANDPPPPEFLIFAQLDDQTWLLFEEVAALLQQGQPVKIDIPIALTDIFVAWAETYANLPPEETQRLLNLNRQLILERTTATGSDAEPGVEAPVSDQTIVDHLWQQTLDQLQLQIPREIFNTWLKQTEVYEQFDGVFVIDAKNSYARAWLETRFAATIEETLSSVVGLPTTVRFVVTGESPPAG